AARVQETISEFKVPWHVTRLGCRAEYLFCAKAPKNGTEAHDAMDFELERLLHLYCMNRGILLTPFHNMALMSPATSKDDIDHSFPGVPRGGEGTGGLRSTRIGVIFPFLRSTIFSHVTFS